MLSPSADDTVIQWAVKRCHERELQSRRCYMRRRSNAIMPKGLSGRGSKSTSVEAIASLCNDAAPLLAVIAPDRVES
jgi:hypothetical protein